MASRWVKPVVGFVVTALFVYLLLHNIEFARLAAAFTSLSAPYLLFALACLAAGYCVRIVRWWWMLRTLEPGLPLSDCVWPFLTSIAVNNTVPFRAGDALRVFAFRKELRSPPLRVLGTLVVERLLDLIALLAFFFVGLLGLPPGTFPDTFVTVAIWLAGGSLGGVLALVLAAPWLPRLVRTFADRPAFADRGWSDTVHRLGMNLIEALSLLRSPSRLVALLGLSVVNWAFEGGVFATVAIAFDTGAGKLGPWFALSTATLATLIPSSPGYVGTFDYFAVLGLTAYGASRETAVAFALTVHAVLWLPLTALGLGYLLLRGERIWHDPLVASSARRE